MRKTKESVECARIDGPIRWIRFERYTRYHAIYASHWGVYLWALDTAPGSPR